MQATKNKKTIYCRIKNVTDHPNITSIYFSFVRYKEGHAIRHWKETQHCYSLELETQRVWDYVGDNYVHRLIQSKTDGKLVELNFRCPCADHMCGSCGCSVDSGIDEALFSSKVDAVISLSLRFFP